MIYREDDSKEIITLKCACEKLRADKAKLMRENETYKLKILELENRLCIPHEWDAVLVDLRKRIREAYQVYDWNDFNPQIVIKNYEDEQFRIASEMLESEKGKEMWDAFCVLYRSMGEK